MASNRPHNGFKRAFLAAYFLFCAVITVGHFHRIEAQTKISADARVMDGTHSCQVCAFRGAGSSEPVSLQTLADLHHLTSEVERAYQPAEVVLSDSYWRSPSTRAPPVLL